MMKNWEVIGHISTHSSQSKHTRKISKFTPNKQSSVESCKPEKSSLTKFKIQHKPHKQTNQIDWTKLQQSKFIQFSCDSRKSSPKSFITQSIIVGVKSIEKIKKCQNISQSIQNIKYQFNQFRQEVTNQLKQQNNYVKQMVQEIRKECLNVVLNYARSHNHLSNQISNTHPNNSTTLSKQSQNNHATKDIIQKPNISSNSFVKKCNLPIKAINFNNLENRIKQLKDRLSNKTNKSFTFNYKQNNTSKKISNNNNNVKQQPKYKLKVLNSTFNHQIQLKNKKVRFSDLNPPKDDDVSIKDLEKQMKRKKQEIQSLNFNQSPLRLLR